VGRPGSTFTFISDDIWLGEFNLPVGDPAWDRSNAVSDQSPLIAIPRTTVGIQQEGRPFVVADPTRAVCYPAAQPYRRAVLSADGDRCSFIVFSQALAAEAAAAYDPAAAADPDMYRFPFVTADIDRDDYVRHQGLRRAVAHDAADTDSLRESLYWMLARTVASGYADTFAGAAAQRRPQTSRAHAEATDAVRAALGRRLDANLTLDLLAAAVHMSPFHLSRVFREQTGRSIHAYRTEVRLRASLGRIADGERLADVAAAVGFASHAHLTDRFRRAYGVTPQEWRAGQKRTNLEASTLEANIA
jgi:AraC-like DNA-binding protein